MKRTLSIIIIEGEDLKKAAESEIKIKQIKELLERKAALERRRRR